MRPEDLVSVGRKKHEIQCLAGDLKPGLYGRAFFTSRLNPGVRAMFRWRSAWHAYLIREAKLLRRLIDESQKTGLRISENEQAQAGFIRDLTPELIYGLPGGLFDD